MQQDVLFDGVSFAYPDAPKPLLEGLDCHFARGWSGIVGANGAGKTTVMRLALGELEPTAGRIETVDYAVYCPQRTDEAPPLFEELAADAGAEACQLRGRLGVAADWPGRWDSLSHGERKRAQIATALWQRPLLLAVDEPTNHLDAAARAMLETALAAFDGVGLLVSHDRDLLDRLCRQCLFVEPPQGRLRPGGVSQGLEEGQREDEATQRQHDRARQQRQKIEREAVRRREEAARQQKRRSKRGLGKDNDARFKRNLARATGKDGAAGRQLRQLDGRLQRARQQHEGIKVRKTYDLGIWLEGARSRRDLLFRLPAGCLPLGQGRQLIHPDLDMRPEARVALTGPNGGGKSTLIRRIVADLNVEAERLVYIPQEIAAGEAAALLKNVRTLPGDELGKVMTVVSCLGSRPERLLDSDSPSPGEARKLLLALGVARVPHLIVLDEPTNHLDLPSIECLEEALDGCPCGLLLVSHDRRFLTRLCRSRWQIGAAGDDMELKVEEG